MELPHVRGQGQQPRVPGCNSAGTAEKSYPASKVSGGGREKIPHALKPETRGGRWEELPHIPTPEDRGCGREEQAHA